MSDSIEAAIQQAAASASATGPTTPIVIKEDRSIVVPTALQQVAVQCDNEANVLHFVCPRNWADIDLAAAVLYINVVKPDKSIVAFTCTNVASSENTVTFDWVITGHITEVAGKLSFLVCARDPSDPGDGYRWHSNLCNSLFVAPGIVCTVPSDTPDPPHIPLYGTDTTLTEPGVPADAAAVGGRLRSLSEEKANKIDTPVSAEVDENNLVSFKNCAGKVLFTLQLFNGGGSTEGGGSLSPFAAVNWLDTVYAVGDNGRYGYNGWCPETVAYDATRQKIVFVQFHCDFHGGKFKERTMCLIDPYDPTVYTAVPNFPSGDNGIGGLVVENGVWTVYGPNYRYRSSDGGETWETTAVVTKPARLFGVNKIDGVLYAGDDALDDTHNGWYYVSEDDGLNWTQHTFDFASQYALSCGEARFCKFKGELYAALRREGEFGLLAKQVDGVWTVVYEELPNVTSDSSLLAFEDLIAISSVDRPNKKLVLSTWDGSALVVSKEVSFVGLTSSGDFHTPTYICGEDWQAVFFMLFGMRSNEYQSALNAALFGYKDGVSANTPTYETELVTYAWSDFLAEPHARATAVEVTDTALNWTPETRGVDALLNISVRVPTMHQVGPDGKVIEYGLVAAPQNIIHIPQRSFNTIQDIKTIGDRKYVCVVEMHPEWCGSFNHAARSVLPVKFMGIATPNVLDYDMTGAQHIATAYGSSSSSNATASAYRVVYNS